LAQAAGIAFVVARRRDDDSARLRGIKWMVAAPLIMLGSLVLILMAGTFIAALFG